MRPRRRLGYTLLINILVSALVTGAVIFFYDRAHRAECVSPLPDAFAGPTMQTRDKIRIAGVVGVGVLDDERLLLANEGTDALILTGWYFKDEQDLKYIFPQLTLFPGVSVEVHTAPGRDTPIDLYWGRSAAVWSSGELISLYDAQDNIRAFFRIP